MEGGKKGKTVTLLLLEFAHQEVQQCPSQHDSVTARMNSSTVTIMARLLNMQVLNKGLYNICNVNNSQTFFLPCSLCENRWFIQLYFRNAIFSELQLDSLFKVACLAHISML